MAQTLLSTQRASRLYFILALILMLVGFAAYVFMFLQIRSASSQEAVLEQENATLVSREASIGDIRKNLLAVQDGQTILSSYVVDASDIVPFLETIEGYAKLVGVSSKFTTVSLSDNSQSLMVSVSAEGSFTNMYRFLALVEASPYQLSIQTTQLQSQVSTTAATPVKGVAAAQPGKDWSANISFTVVAVPPAK